jgi:hypothetical protein
VRPRLLAGVALAAVVAVVVALVASGGGSTGGGAAPTVLQASGAAGLQPATRPAPAESPRNGHVLTASAAGISFPYWEAPPLRWRASGARLDTVGGRTVTTVFYGDRAGRRIGYSIVSGAALPLPAGAALQHGGLTFHVLRSGPTTVVTWREAGHTCILTARGIAPGTLVRLAAWQRV